MPRQLPWASLQPAHSLIRSFSLKHLRTQAYPRESSGNFETVDSSDASSVETQAETAGGFTQLQSVDGTTVTEIIGEGDYALTLDANVHIPDVSPQEGTFAAKSLDLSAIEDALGNGETLSPESSGTRYTSQDGSISFFCFPLAPLAMPCLKIRI